MVKALLDIDLIGDGGVDDDAIEIKSYRMKPQFCRCCLEGLFRRTTLSCFIDRRRFDRRLAHPLSLEALELIRVANLRGRRSCGA